MFPNTTAPRGAVLAEDFPMIATQSSVTSATNSLQTMFMNLVPRIQTHARIYFRDIRCAIRKADCIAEVVAIAWKWFCRLMKKGRDATRFVSTLATLAARAVRSGRRACGGDRVNDVMSPVAQRRHGFTVQSLLTTSQARDALNGKLARDVMEDRLVDNTVTPPDQQAQFRIDFPRWLRTLSSRERRILRAMSMNEKTRDLSRKFDVTPGRISQMRREFKDGWSRFVGDDMVAA